MKTELIYRRFVTIVFLAAFFAQMSGKAFVIADYYTNTIKYSRNCVNKARPMMHCNGKCQMMKKLQQQEKDEQENQERQAANKIGIVLSTESFFATAPVHYILLKLPKKPLPSCSGTSIDRSFDIFHPPQA